LQLILTEHSNVHRNPYIIASGITGDFDSGALTFNLTPSQYINLPHTILTCPIYCFIDSESKKWKGRKPLPTTGTTVSVSGTLTKIRRDADRHPTFEIELDNIAYLSRQSPVPTTSSNRTYDILHSISYSFKFDNKHKEPLSSISTSRTRFNYDNPTTSFTKKERNTDDTSPNQVTPTPGPSSVALGKRKKNQDETEDHLTMKRPHITDDTSNRDIVIISKKEGSQTPTDSSD
jgi:hypothetical protein